VNREKMDILVGRVRHLVMLVEGYRDRDRERGERGERGGRTGEEWKEMVMRDEEGERERGERERGEDR
jgi:hypothetical protein